MKDILKIILFFILFCVVVSCTTTNKDKSVHGDKPLIDPSKVLIEGQKEMEKKVTYGPKPYDSDTFFERNKSKTITTEHVRNYVSIPDDYGSLKQNVSINLNNVDFSSAMSLLAEIGGINILVGDEVSGTVTAKIQNVSWDVAFQTILDMKTLGADINVANGIIRVHSPEVLQNQESFKSDLRSVLKKRQQADQIVEPILAKIFYLYYISPAQAKKTLEDLFASQQGPEGGSTMENVKITEENTTRSIIVRGREPDLDIIDAVIREIDVKTRQVLIEAFIVDATSDFKRALGARLGGVYARGGRNISGLIGGAATTPAGVTLGNTATAGTATNMLDSISGTTSGIGILKQTGSATLKLELEALESLGKNRIVSSPSVFTLNNQEAKITQGREIAYSVTSEGTTTTEFKEAALSLTVTPSIIGDGNVLLDIQINNDSPEELSYADQPAIKTNQITTRLLVSDGDIVVIGGIKINTTTDNKNKTPGLSEVPVVGNLFKSKNKSDKLEEMLIFLAPRVI